MRLKMTSHCCWLVHIDHTLGEAQGDPQNAFQPRTLKDPLTNEMDWVKVLEVRPISTHNHCPAQERDKGLMLMMLRALDWATSKKIWFLLYYIWRYDTQCCLPVQEMDKGSLHQLESQLCSVHQG